MPQEQAARRADAERAEQKQKRLEKAEQKAKAAVAGTARAEEATITPV